MTEAGKLSHLKRLFFDSKTLSSGALAHLAGLTKMEDLRAWIPVKDNGLRSLGKMQNLHTLHVQGDVTEEGLKHLMKLKSLQQLWIRTGNEISAQELQDLEKELPFLRSVTYRKRQDIRERPKIEAMAPMLAGQTLRGNDFKLSNYRGKAVLLYFWATWCSPCVASTPALKEFYEELKSNYQDFELIGVSLSAGDLFLRRHVQMYELKWPQVYLGVDSEVAADYGVSAVPTYILVGPDGKILLDREDDWGKIKAAVAEALGEPI